MNPVSILYQCNAPPAIDGCRKPNKGGGYSDSGADIAYGLREAGIEIITVSDEPTATDNQSWVFPDSREGIRSAISSGAKTLWMNTTLFENHPISRFISEDIRIVGQLPAQVQIYDNKWTTNELLRVIGCNIPPSVLIGKQSSTNSFQLSDLTTECLRRHNLDYPMVVKPVRGRGSQGVLRVSDSEDLVKVAGALFAETVVIDGTEYSKYGDKLILEKYLCGDEITLTVMPPGKYKIEGKDKIVGEYWTLPPVKRFNHRGGIIPYSGTVPVSENSEVLEGPARTSAEVRMVVQQCEIAARAVQARAPIRIDCRMSSENTFYIFDLNMKPNLTGPGRPGRDNQDSLCSIAARCFGWSYQQLLVNILNQAWLPEDLR